MPLCKKIVYFFVSLLFSVSFVVSATINNLSLVPLSVQHGLSQGTINTIIQDDEGYIWIGTENGLNLYDGYHFRALPGPDSSLLNSNIMDVMQGQNGIIWINADGEGIYAYNKKNDQYHFISAKRLDDRNYHIADIVEGDNNTIYIATAKTLTQYNPQTQQKHLLLDLSNQLNDKKNINSIFYHDKVIYIATELGIYALDSQTKQWKALPIIGQDTLTDKLLVNSVETAKTYHLQVSPKNALYIGTNDGIFKLDINNINEFIQGAKALSHYQTIIEHLPSWQFYLDDSELYIGSHLGLSRVSMDTDKVEYLFGFNDIFDHLTSNLVRSILKDKQGVFWLGSNNNGIFKWDPKLSLIQNYRYKKSSKESLTDNLVWTIIENKSAKNEVWVGTANGLNLVNLKDNSIQQFLAQKLKKVIYTDSYIFQLQQDNDEHIWIRNANNIQLFDIKTKKIIPIPFPKETLELLKPESWLFNIDSENYAWLITEAGLNRINLTTGEFDPMDEIDQTIGDKQILNVLGFLPNTRAMLISTNKSLWRFDLDTRQAKKLYTHPDILPTEWSFIDSWTIDKNNIFWLGLAPQGLVGLDATTFEPKYFYDKSNSIIDENPYGLVTDKEGDIWFSSHNGIYMMDVDSHHFRNFNLLDGLGAREYNSGASIKHSNGLLVYGSINGFTVFDPLVLKQKAYETDLTIKISNIDVLSRDIHLPFIRNQQQLLKLNYDDIGIKVEFSPLLYSHHHNITFEYTLISNEKIVYPETPDNYITFATLASGNYELQVRVRSPITGELSAPTSLFIQVSYAPWASPTAYVLYVVIFLSLFIYWLNTRKKHTRELLHINEEVQRREQRLTLALHGSNSEVWDWQAEDNLIFAKRASKELGYQELGESYPLSEHLKLIHNSDREAFTHQWHEFIREADLNESFSCSYRMRTHDGQWLWFKDLGKIVTTDEAGHPTRITGSYTNITQSRADAEKAQYYGEAFEQTKDWVFIISNNFSRIVVNKSLQDALGWQGDEISFDNDVFGLSKEKLTFYRRLFSSLKEFDHWRGEELIYAKTGEEYHVLLNINVNRNKDTNSLHFVCIATDITAQKKAEKELRHLANYDHLTDLPNRSLLSERIKHAMDYSARFKRSIALFFIDLDRFKQVNDSLGHDQGDILLQEITRRLKTTLRVDDTIARIGGDEFVILLESFNNNSQLSKIAHKVIIEINKPIQLKGQVVSVGASIGISLYPEDSTNSDELLKNADVAMYHAKQIGRNTFQFFTPRMNVEANQRFAIETSIKNAFEQDKFINYYQPIMNSLTGKVVGVELLLRWQKDEQLILPEKFISIAEELDLIISMTEAALKRGFIDLTTWHQEQKDLFLSVNLSVQHFATDDLINKVKLLLNQYEIAPSQLKLEITESTFITDPRKIIQTMRALADFGVELVLDDFGSGYSSLNYLKTLPLHSLKIDQSFIKGIGVNSHDEAIVDAILVLTKNLNIYCIAEGVETIEQRNFLAERQCYAIQGFFYSRALPADKIAPFIIDNKQETPAI
ncbi:EAL domain-containing protein [Thalassotalea piscium]